MSFLWTSDNYSFSLNHWSEFVCFFSFRLSENLFPSMILHIFSHSSLLHLSVNMYVLYSCLSMVNFHLGPNQSWALYLSAGKQIHYQNNFNIMLTIFFFSIKGVFASLISIVHKSCRKIHQPSIGAVSWLKLFKWLTLNLIFFLYLLFLTVQSGAILGLLAASCMINPEAKLGIVFIPNLLIPAKYGICGIIALDTMGIIRQWKLFDHAAHLGGTIFGM